VKAGEILRGQRQQVLIYSFLPLFASVADHFNISLLMSGCSFLFHMESGYFFKLVTFSQVWTFDLVFEEINYKKYYRAVSREKHIWCNHYIANVDSEKHWVVASCQFCEKVCID
jgi:hypothetical protein